MKFRTVYTRFKCDNIPPVHREYLENGTRYVHMYYY